MDQNNIRQLEQQIGVAIADVLRKDFPGQPVSPRTVRLMAKAAVAVLEAVAETHGGRPPKN